MKLKIVNNSPMSLRWKRGPKIDFDFDKVLRWCTLGIVGSGKSSFLETIGEFNLRAGNSVLDLFSSKDGESLAWLRSPWVLKDKKKVALIHGQGIDVKTVHDTIRVDKLTLRDLEKYDILISTYPLYMSAQQEFNGVTTILAKIHGRRHYKRTTCAIVREASSLLYSRIRINQAQTQTKNQSVYLLRESRHSGCGICLDSLRLKSIDVDIRVTYDFQIIKSLGVPGLPDDLEWLYGYFSHQFVRDMPLDSFILVHKRGGVALGCFKEVEWHKQEKEDIDRAVGIKIERGEGEPEEAKDMGTFLSVSDNEHAEIIDLYFLEELSMAKIEKKKHRSRSTISDHIHNHVNAIKRSGFCPSCKRVNGKCYTTKERGD